MPYIKQEARHQLDEQIAGLADAIKKLGTSPGNINYSITRLIVLLNSEPENYTTYNSMIGVLECVKQEMYRCLVSRYEEKKKNENGDCYQVIQNSTNVTPVQR